MVTIVDAMVPSEQFALAETVADVPEGEFKMVPIVAHQPKHVLPFVWAWSPHPDELYEAMQLDSSTKSVERFSQGESHDLYYIEWQPDVRHVISGIVEEFCSLLGTRCRNGWWKFRLLFMNHEAVSETYEFCREHGLDLAIRRVYGVNDVSDFVDNGGASLSEEQHEALTSAFETGYYGVPRGMTLQELSNEIGVSHQALSERLRRGHKTLISNTLCDTPEVVESDP
jgi:predicted DNA binding protein